MKLSLGLFTWLPTSYSPFANQFFILNPPTPPPQSYFLKVTKFLVKISQFDFLVMETEENIVLCL